MKFKIKRTPTLGDSRWVRKFAWLPKKVGRKGTIIWFERYISQQMYDTWKVPGPGYKGTRLVIGWRELHAWMWGGEGTSIITNR